MFGKRKNKIKLGLQLIPRTSFYFNLRNRRMDPFITRGRNRITKIVFNCNRHV